MQYPTNYISITTYYSSSHKGLDLGFYSALHHHQPILAVEDGEVIYSKFQNTGGKTVHIRHKINGEWYVSEYGHMQTVNVVLGQKVKRNQKIGTMGSTGIVDGEHCHCGICKGYTITYTSKDVWINPINILYVYPSQTVHKETIKKYGDKLRYYDIPEKGIYKTKYNMYIRKNPNGSIVKVKDCTSAMKKALTSNKPNDNAIIKKGIKFTALDVEKSNKSYWAKNYSGYICIKDETNEFCKKV